MAWAGRRFVLGLQQKMNLDDCELNQIGSLVLHSLHCCINKYLSNIAHVIYSVIIIVYNNC